MALSESISSIPGATKFRSIGAVIIVVACMAIYLVYIENLAVEADRVARDRVINDIRGSLAMMLYDYSIKGQLKDLVKFDGENPFVILAIYRSLPSNYRGTIESALENHTQQGWYFDLNDRQVIFVSLDEGIDRYRLVFEYEDRDGDGRFDMRTDGVGRLELQQAM